MAVARAFGAARNGDVPDDSPEDPSAAPPARKILIVIGSGRALLAWFIAVMAFMLIAAVIIVLVRWNPAQITGMMQSLAPVLVVLLVTVIVALIVVLVGFFVTIIERLTQRNDPPPPPPAPGDTLPPGSRPRRISRD
jgi:hypothetical protein